MKEKDRKESRKRTLLRVFFGAMSICAAVVLLGDLAARTVAAMGGFSFSLNHASSIGIIGGADGPTSVLIMSAAAPVWHMILEALVLILGIMGWRHFKK